MEDAIKARASEGKYYALSSEVWGDKWESYEGAFDKLMQWRKDTKHTSYYRRLLASIGFASMPESDSRGSSQGNSTVKSGKYKYQHQRIDLRGARKRDPFGAINGEDAHQTPDSPNCCPPHAPVLQAILGIDIEGADLEALSKAYAIVKGVEKDPTEANRKTMAQAILKYLANDSPMAVKNLPINLLRVPGPHGEVYDDRPSLITIPCFDSGNLTGMKKWQPGKPYSILVIASDEETYEAMIGAKPLNRGGTHVDVASPEELNYSTMFLQKMVLAHAELASGSRTNGVVYPEDYENIQWNMHLKDVRATFSKGGEVRVPVFQGSGQKVLKLTLDSQETSYFIPDPMLVLMKGALNWYYTFTRTKLLPGCGPLAQSSQKEVLEEHGRMNEEEMYELHQETLEELYEESIHPQGIEDLAKGLGQWTPSTPQGPTPVPRVSLSPDEIKGLVPPKKDLVPRVSLSPEYKTE